MSIAAFLAHLRRARRRSQPPVSIWLCVWSPNDRLAVVIWQ